VPTFSACLDNRTHQQTVIQMADAAAAAGITQTPTFVVNGRPVFGADYDELKAIIEEQLAGP
jgi:protein-disulfide isomerase